MGFKSGQKVEFVAGNGKVYQGEFVRQFYPAKNAGPHYRIKIQGGVVATVFAKGKVGRSVKAV